jgi:alpha-L-rhamnosidase
VRVVGHPKNTLIAPDAPPVRRIEEVTPVKILTSPSGQTIVDMAQNMVGWVRLIVEGPAGTTVTLRHAEVLDQKGNFYTDNLRAAAQQVVYTLKGGGKEVFEPRFTFQGFRYVLVEGFPGTLTLDNVKGVVVHSAMAPTSEFSTSHPLINQLQHNIRWGQKGNFVDVPTDCPQRDERLGWTGDAQAFSRTAAFNMNVAGFFTKWLKDVAADQLESGSVPHVVPAVLTRP